MNRALFGTLAAATMLASPATGQSRRTWVAPYIELGQTVTADLSRSDDVLTYSSVAAGIDAGINTARAEGQISYRYERRIAWDDSVGDDDVHSGLARGSFQVARGVSIDGGALATRTRSDIRGAAPGVLAGNVDNISQVYSAYVGPSVSTNAGPVQINAGYQFGYTKVEVPNATGVPAGQQRLDYFDSSTGHVATVSAGVAAGTVLPVGVTVSAAYDREDASQLKQRYEGKFVRGDVMAPVSATVALRGGIGYEKITTSQKDAVVDVVGNPVLDGNGRFVTNEASPRRIAYNTDGLIYDAGVVWRPNTRLEAQAGAGWRYGGRTYFGSLAYRMSRDVGLNVQVYDGVQTFGRQLRQGLQNLPTGFVGTADPFGQQFSGCVFGSQPGGTGTGAAGGCLNDVFQSVTTASYRARGIDGVVTATRGRTTFGAGAGYANRKFYTPQTVSGVTLYGTEDESYYGQLFWSRALSRTANLDANVYAQYSESGVANVAGSSGGVFGAGATTSLTKTFGRLGTLASLGVYMSDVEGADEDWVGQALIGARYTF